MSPPALNAWRPPPQLASLADQLEAEAVAFLMRWPNWERRLKTHLALCDFPTRGWLAMDLPLRQAVFERVEAHALDIARTELEHIAGSIELQLFASQLQESVYDRHADDPSYRVIRRAAIDATDHAFRNGPIPLRQLRAQLKRIAIDQALAEGGKAAMERAANRGGFSVRAAYRHPKRS